MQEIKHRSKWVYFFIGVVIFVFICFVFFLLNRPKFDSHWIKGKDKNQIAQKYGVFWELREVERRDITNLLGTNEFECYFIKEGGVDSLGSYPTEYFAIIFQNGVAVDTETVGGKEKRWGKKGYKEKYGLEFNENANGRFILSVDF